MLGVGRGAMQTRERGARKGAPAARPAPPRLQPETPPLLPPPGCLDMLSVQGQFTFTADRPQLHCAAFFISEPEEFITIHYDLVSIDCQGGDFLKVRCPTERPQLWGMGWGMGPGAAPSGAAKVGELVTIRCSTGAGVGGALQDPHATGTSPNFKI